MEENDYMSLEEDDDDDYYHSSDDQQSYNEEESDVSSRKPTSQIITKESLVAAQNGDLVKVMELLSVKKSQARTLLIHYRWNVDELFSVFAEKGKDRLFSSAGLTVFDPSLLVRDHHSSMMNCDICIEEDLPSGAMTRMECGHRFCNDCWKEHFTIKINEGQSKRIRCMAHKCNAVCDEDVVRNLVRPELADKFDRFLVESYVEDNKLVKWCPSTPHCGNAIRKTEDDGEVEVECSCGLQFCFSCLCKSHSPCSCLMWKLWSKKCEDESETVNWITVNTKFCPKCNKAVSKSEGCNLMTCICGQHFCWLCGGATGISHTWTSIAGHSCGRYTDDKVKLLERAKRDLDRYIHYHYRYKSHTDSSKLEDKLRETILEKVSKSEKKDQLVFKDLSWVTNGLDRLFRSRRILAYSYPFAFYMFGEELFKDEMSDAERELKKNLFEDQQQQLECNVERLSKILKEPFDDAEYGYEKAMDMKNQLNNMCIVVDKLCRKMYECIENDLLGPIQVGIHNIALYRSKGIEQAAQFCASDCGSSGGTSCFE